MIMHVNEWKNNNRGMVKNSRKGLDGNLDHRTVVVSLDGVARAGIYCAASYCFEQAESRGLVDVFQAVRNAKKFRPQLVPNTKEYQYCYDLVLDYIRKYAEINNKII